MTSPYNSGDPNFQQPDSIFGTPQQQPSGPGPMPQQQQPAMNAGAPQQHVQQVVNVNLTAAQVQGMAGAEPAPPVQHAKSFGVYMLCLAFGGYIGAHHYYTGNIGRGLLYTCTLGLFMFGWLGDLVNARRNFNREMASQGILSAQFRS
ncbi:TM2 domain-containing protein [Corynebacterium matruchotii]|uniref:TM2 domain-containing protein n=1 Tax=Corynebacterium matruchotii TaxID=43768 RepID=UPI0028E2E88F|nr:TM2 domain-containing protein [Corynebacterium matruchotii]